MPPANHLQQAKSLIRAGKLSEARNLLRQILYEDPQNYVAWLLLARTTSSTKAALGYVQQAESIRPGSRLVKRELRRFNKTKRADQRQSHLRPYLLLSSALIILICLIVWLAPLGFQRVIAYDDDQFSEKMAQEVITPLAVSSQIEVTPEPQPTLLPTPTARPLHREKKDSIQPPKILAAVRDNKATQADGQEIQPSPQAPAEDTADPAQLNTPPPEPAGLRPSGVGPADRWIDVNLTTQTLVAYEGDTPVFNSLISSGLWDTPTVTGQFRTVMKYESQDMNGYSLGYDYYLQDVPYVMYFFEDYAIHGAYWHNNFGTPMSHGCVNMNPVDAGWLYNWAPIGTMVSVHH